MAAINVRNLRGPRCTYCGATIARHGRRADTGPYCHGGFWCKTPVEWAEWHARTREWNAHNTHIMIGDVRGGSASDADWNDYKRRHHLHF